MLYLEQSKVQEAVGMEATLEKSEQESKLELYSLLNEGYRDIKEGRTTSLEDFEEEIRLRRQSRGSYSAS